MMNAIVEAIERNDATRVALKAGIIPRDAQWVIDGAYHAQDAGVTDGAGGLDAHDLAAEVLYDLQRKQRGFTREVFVSWMESAIKIRALDDSDVVDVCEFVREAWPQNRATRGRAK
jgi:hypothetical protein